MELLKKVFENWDNILTAVILIVIGIQAINKFVKENGQKLEEMTVTEKMQYVKRLLENLVPIAIVLTTNAEIKYGGGTGVLKRSVVIDELYKRIPDEFKKYVNEDNLNTVVETALAEAKKIWDSNANVKRLLENKEEIQ